MANKVSNFSDLIQRVTASCLLHPLAAGRHGSGEISPHHSQDDTDAEEEEEEVIVEEEKFRGWEEATINKETEMEMVMGEVFDAVSCMKRAYVTLQEAHCPWDPDKMRGADASVVAELKRIGMLRERFRRTVRGGTRLVGATLREVVAPYEAAVEDLKRELKYKQTEVDNLRDKLKIATSPSGGKKSKPHYSHRKLSCSATQPQVTAVPPELYEATMSSVKEASKSFTSLLLSLMRSAHWDIAAAVRSIEAATATANTTTATVDAIVGPNHAKYALESYVNRKLFQGFDHETFYMDGSLSSLLHPDQFRRDCFTQYRDMKAMDPTELLGILPNCHFGMFCSKKFLSVVHPKMEESLFGDLEQRRQVLAGNHPRSRFYGEFLSLAKAVWLLHLLAFSMDPPPSHFEASRGAEFHPEYMESVVRYPGGRVGVGQLVGFPVSPGFKLGNGSLIKARVYLVPKNGF